MSQTTNHETPSMLLKLFVISFAALVLWFVGMDSLSHLKPAEGICTVDHKVFTTDKAGVKTLEVHTNQCGVLTVDPDLIPAAHVLTPENFDEQIAVSKTYSFRIVGKPIPLLGGHPVIKEKTLLY